MLWGNRRKGLMAGDNRSLKETEQTIKSKKRTKEEWKDVEGRKFSFVFFYSHEHVMCCRMTWHNVNQVDSVDDIPTQHLIKLFKDCEFVCVCVVVIVVNWKGILLLFMLLFNYNNINVIILFIFNIVGKGRGGHL